MSGKEKCPHCVKTDLVARTNMNGQVYLECRDNCGYFEGVSRKVDPFPTIITEYTNADGTKRKRYSVASKRSPKRFLGEAAA